MDWFSWCSPWSLVRSTLISPGCPQRRADYEAGAKDENLRMSQDTGGVTGSTVKKLGFGMAHQWGSNHQWGLGLNSLNPEELGIVLIQTHLKCQNILFVCSNIGENSNLLSFKLENAFLTRFLGA
jgi:hypothetical protein